MKATKLKAGTFMGQTQKQRALNGFTLSTTDHSRHMKVPKHEHEFPYVSLLLHGVYQEKSILSEYDIKSGCSLFRPKGFEHKNEIGSHNSFCFNIEIEKQLSDKTNDSKFSDYMAFERNNLEIMKIYYGFQEGFSNELLGITVEENLYHLFQQQYSENRTGRTPWVNKIKRDVRLHPEQTYSIDEVANTLHLHPHYFVRKFKDKTGFTFGEFLLRQRLAMSVDLMVHSKKPLTEIAVESGFYDQSHFIRHFKRFFGVTPFHYRKIIKG